jgi:lipopolysaccharide/colanic/teichoic acid biosynthesis glycosyltransferase
MNCPRSLNVFRGEMSLIGPRPDDLPHAHAFLADIPGYRQRYAVGPAFLALRRWNWATSTAATGRAGKTKIDLHYIRHAGLRLDARDLLAHAQDRRRPQGAVTPRGPKTPWPLPPARRYKAPQAAAEPA